MKKSELREKSKKQEALKEDEGRSFPWLTVILAAIVVIALAILFYPSSTKTEGNTTVITEEQPGPQIKTVEKTITVEEPYNVTEEYEEKIPFGQKTCANKGMNSTVVEQKQLITTNAEGFPALNCSVEIRNDEDSSGSWRYKANVETDKGTVAGGGYELLIPAHESVVFSWIIDLPADVSTFQCNFFVDVKPSIEKCFYAEPVTYTTVKKIRTVTMYRNVTKTVTVPVE